jgi:hypothetical protein
MNRPIVFIFVDKYKVSKIIEPYANRTRAVGKPVAYMPFAEREVVLENG